MLDMKIEKIGENQSKLYVGGDLTVGNIKSFHSKVCDLFEEVDCLIVHLNKSTNIDMTFYQVVCTAHRAFVAADKTFSLDGDLDTIFGSNREIGYMRHKGCAFDKNKNCVLVHKEAS